MHKIKEFSPQTLINYSFALSLRCLRRKSLECSWEINLQFVSRTTRDGSISMS